MTAPPLLNYRSPTPPNPRPLRKLMFLVAFLLAVALGWFGVFVLVARNSQDAIVPCLAEYLCLAVTFVFALVTVILVIAKRAGKRSVILACTFLITTVGLFFAVGFWYQTLPSTTCMGVLAPFAALLGLASRR